MIRMAIVGVGGIAAEHLKYFNENQQSKLVAVCDIVQANADRIANQYGVTPYTDFDIMLEMEQLDALVVCVPPFARQEIEEKAVSRGIHLLVEKPLGLEMEMVRKKARLISSSNIIAATGYCLRYLDTVAKAKEYLQGKEVAMVRAHRFGGFVETPWWRDMAKSGGQLVEQTTHNLDLMRYLAGDIKKVSADMALRVMDDIPGINIPDVCSVNVVFESGAIGHLDTSFVEQPDGRSSLEVIGRGFRLTLDGTTLTIAEKQQTTTYKSQVNFYKEQDDAFIQAIVTGDHSFILAPYEEALKTLEVTLAANDSAKWGRPVTISQEMAV